MKLQKIITVPSFFLSLSIFLVLCSAAFAQKEPVKKQSEAIRIISEKMEVKDQRGTVVFTGNVVAKKGALTIYSDVLEVYYTKKSAAASSSGGSKGKRRLEKIVVRGHLRIVQGKRRATAEKAVYYKPKEKIVLIKNARIWDGANTIKGDKITLFVNENRSVVESSGKDRVEAVVYSE